MLVQKRLGEILTEADIISKEQLQEALQKQKQSNGRLGEILTSLGYTDEEIILSLLGKQLGASYIKISEFGSLNMDAIKTVPESVARRNALIPISKDGETLTLAMADPRNMLIKDVLRMTTGCHIKAHISSQIEINEAIDRYYKSQQEVSHRCLPLNKLGFEPTVLKTYEEAIKVGSGLILFMGPENSGKTTTLYSTLNALNCPDKSLTAFETSIESALQEDASIVKVTSDDRQFRVKQFLSMKSDVIMIGEMRDHQTAEAAMKAAAKGHLVFSVCKKETLDELFSFFKEMDVDPSLMASTMRMIVNGRLVQKLCSHCKTPVEHPENIIKRIGGRFNSDEEFTLYKRQGCLRCNFTGFEGYTGCFEVMVIDDVIKDLIVRQASPQEIRGTAKDRGMLTLEDAAIKKVLEGATDTINQITYAIANMDIDKIIKVKEAEEMKPRSVNADFYWEVFERTGSIEAYMLYKKNRQ